MRESARARCARSRLRSGRALHHRRGSADRRSPDRRRRAAGGKPAHRHSPSIAGRRRPRPAGSARCRRRCRSIQPHTEAGLARFGGNDQRHLSVGRSHELRIEQIGSHRILERHFGAQAPRHIRSPGTALATARRSARCLSANACSCANSTRSFATATTSLWKAPAAIASSDCSAKIVRVGIETVQPCDRLRRLDMLSGRKCAAGHAINEDFDARLAMARGAAACGSPRLRLRMPEGSGREPRNAAVAESDVQLRQASTAIHGFGAAWSGGSRPSDGTCRRRYRARVRRSRRSPPTSPRPTSRWPRAPVRRLRSSCRARQASARWGRGCGRKMP